MAAMSPLPQARRVRVYCEQGDRHGHTPLATAIVQLLWHERASGVTVFNAVEGFGARHVIHSAHLVDLGANAPVLVEWLERPERFELIWPKLAPLVEHAVVTVEDVSLLVPPHDTTQAG